MAILRHFTLFLVGLASHFLPTAADTFPSASASPSAPYSYSKRSDLSGGFSLAVSTKPDSERDFVRDWAAAHQKWGRGVPEEVASTFFTLLDSDGRVDVQPLGSDDIYIANIKVGNPPQTVKLALDTGSADLWMQSTDTVYRVNQNGPWAPRYHPNMSRTAEIVQDAEWHVQYMDGTAANGIVFLDTVRLGGFQVENATIQSARTVASRFERETGLSGIMGLAKSLPSNIHPPQYSFLELLHPQLEFPVFTADLRRNATGRFDFGYIDETLASDNITWVDSDRTSHHWDVRFDLTAWTGKDDTWWYHEFNATIDTGTTLMFLPDVLASMYWFTIPGMRVDPRLSNAFTFPCELAKNLPDLKFKIPSTDHVLTIPGPYLNYGPVIGDSDYCWGGMQSADGLNATILGDIMLKAVFVAFDMGESKVGFANKKLDIDEGGD